MLSYDKFYKEIGVRKIKHLVNLKPLDGKELKYPTNSMLFRFTSSDVVNVITRASGTMYNVNRPIVNIKYKYTDDTIGNFKVKYKDNKKFISANKKAERTFTYLKPNVKNLKLSNSKEFIFTYGALTANHKYQSHPLTQYHKWYNAFKTMIADIKSVNSGSDRHKFMIVETPLASFEYSEYIKHNMVVSRLTLDTFYNQKLLTMREILRYLDPETRSDSLLSTLSYRDTELIDIVFINNDKCVVINLYTLLSAVTGNAEKTNLAKYGFKTIYKLLMVFINNMTESHSYSKQDIVSQDSEVSSVVSGVMKTSDGDKDLNTEVNLDSYMDNSSGVDDVEIDDEVVEEIVNDVEVDGYESEYDENLSVEDKIKKHTESLVETKVITRNASNRVNEILKEQSKAKSPYPNDNSKLQDMLSYTSGESDIKESDTDLPDTASVIDKSYNKDTLSVVNSKYLNTMYKKDMVGVIHSLQGTENLIEEHTVEEYEDILGATEQHTIKIKNITGTSNTIKFIVPKVNDDGTFKLSGNKYVMRKQKSDVPIRKIANTMVALTTYYGKLFISKATYKKNDAGFWFRKQLLTKYEESSGIKDLIMMPCDNVGVETPRDYGIVSRYITSYKVKNKLFHFNYNTRTTLLNDETLLKKVEGSKYTLLGMEGKIPLVMDKTNKVYSYDGKYVEIGDLYTILDIDRTKEPIEYANIKVMKNNIPVGILLSYYLGMDRLLKTLNVKYEKTEPGKRLESTNDKLVIKFKDVKYVIDRDYGVSDMVMSGVESLSKKLSDLPSVSMNNRNKFAGVFTTLGLPILYINEIKLMEDMYVDSISKQVLMDMKEPEEFIKLLIRSCELLLLDDYKHPNDVNNMYYKGYERIPGLVYKELISSIRTKNNKSHFSKAKLELNPYSVLGKINEDSTVVLVDDINPIASLKQIEDSTALGFGGRTETTMNKSTRQVHSSEIGITSEGSKDSGSVGVTAYLTANPGIKNARGITKEVNTKEVGLNSLYGTSALLAPYSVNDDPKRINFIQIQNSHVIPIKDMRAPYMRTGYESVFALRVNNDYVTSATEEGVVEKITKDNVSIKHKSGKSVKYKLKSWTTKEESGSCFEHKLVTNLKVKDKISVGDTILYDNSFFEPDIFNSKRVIYKAGTSLTTVLMEDQQTYEDSAAISHKITGKLSAKPIKVKSIVVDVKDNIFDVVNIGDKVDYSTTLFSMLDSMTGDIESMDAETKKLIKSIKTKSPKSKYNGSIVDIKIMYNSELKDMSRSLKKLVNESDERLLMVGNHVGKVNASYSIQGKPLIDGKAEIKIYIKTTDTMGIGDKGIVSNQLKFTVGEVFNYDMIADSGDEIELVFSQRSVSARITNSGELIGTTSMLLEKLTQEAVNTYFK